MTEISDVIDQVWQSHKKESNDRWRLCCGRVIIAVICLGFFVVVVVVSIAFTLLSKLKKPMIEHLDEPRYSVTGQKGHTSENGHK